RGGDFCRACEFREPLIEGQYLCLAAGMRQCPLAWVLGETLHLDADRLRLLDGNDRVGNCNLEYPRIDHVDQPDKQREAPVVQGQKDVLQSQKPAAALGRIELVSARTEADPSVSVSCSPAQHEAESLGAGLLAGFGCFRGFERSGSCNLLAHTYVLF